MFATRRRSSSTVTFLSSTLLFAGHETTSNTISWGLLELARNPACQARLRAELRSVVSTVSELSAADFEKLPYLEAVVKETLRVHPVLPHNFRGAARDDVIPLSKPFTSRSGKLVGEIAVPKGTRVILSLAGYNRCARTTAER